MKTLTKIDFFPLPASARRDTSSKKNVKKSNSPKTTTKARRPDRAAKPDHLNKSENHHKSMKLKIDFIEDQPPAPQAIEIEGAGSSGTAPPCSSQHGPTDQNQFPICWTATRPTRGPAAKKIASAPKGYRSFGQFKIEKGQKR
ncbi:MAG: hypothetical protein ABSA47_08540 [Verrucomicrobiota bacterium]|jgi:hypothetical protein